MSKFSGGHTSILRLGSQLAKNNYNVTYISFIEQSIDSMKNSAYSNLNTYEGNFLLYEEAKNNRYDVIVATNWESVYYAKRMEGYKVYFVQDYEPYFYRYGETYLLAKKTYNFGFHIISLGGWNVKKIKQECEGNIKADVITFPFEMKEYHFKSRKKEDYLNKHHIRMAIYIKDDGKRFPFLIQAMIENMSHEFLKDDIIVEPIYFGIYNEYIPDYGINKGKLNKKELEQLYHKCDFGIVASLTNISLIPYEMIGSGLPIIEFEEGTFLDFFERDDAIITTMNYKDLYLKLKKMLENPNDIIKMTEKAYNKIINLSWENTAKEFEDILRGIIE